MTDSERLSLQLLGRRIELISHDPRWAAFMRSLWSPFETAGASEDSITVHRSDGTWTIDATWHARLQQPDAWLAANEMRHLLTERAVEFPGERVPLHAAGMERDGIACIVAGTSGAGKTTTALALLRAGWSYLTDDLAVLDPEGRIISFPKPLGVKDSSAFSDFADCFGDQPWPEQSPEDVFLVPAACFPHRGPDEPAVRVGLIVLLQREDDHDRVTDLTPAEAIAMCGSYMRRADPWAVRVMATAARDCRCVRLGGGTPTEVADTITKLSAS